MSGDNDFLCSILAPCRRENRFWIVSVIGWSAQVQDGVHARAVYFVHYNSSAFIRHCVHASDESGDCRSPVTLEEMIGLIDMFYLWAANVNESAARLLIIANACITLMFVIAFQPTSAAAFASIAVWLLAPHLVLLGMLTGIRRLENRRLAALRILSVLASAGGVLFLAYLFLAYLTLGPTNAQIAMLVFFTPMFQGAGWLLGLLVVICIPKT